MARPNKLQKFVQRSNMFDGNYVATQEFADETYEVLNCYIFDNCLEPCPVNVRRTRGVWGMCDGRVENDEFRVHEITLTNKYPFRAMFVATLAHEMVHQFQWDVLSNERWEQGKEPVMSHGPSFFAWRPVLAEYNIPLTKSF
jgi:hypothetical protein